MVTPRQPARQPGHASAARFAAPPASRGRRGCRSSTTWGSSADCCSRSSAVPGDVMRPMAFLKRPVALARAITRLPAAPSAAGPTSPTSCASEGHTARPGSSSTCAAGSVAFNGAEPVRADTLERFAALFAAGGFRSAAFFPCYGLAENTLMATGRAPAKARWSAASTASAWRRGKPAAASEGRELVELRTGRRGRRARHRRPRHRPPAAPTGRSERSGCTGRAWPEATGAGPRQAEFASRIDGDERAWFRTGDLGFVLDGELYVTGRIKDLIIVDGRNIHAHDIESSLAGAHPALRPGSPSARSSRTTAAACSWSTRCCGRPTPEQAPEIVDRDPPGRVAGARSGGRRDRAGASRRHPQDVEREDPSARPSRSAFLRGELAAVHTWSRAAAPPRPTREAPPPATRSWNPATADRPRLGARPAAIAPDRRLAQVPLPPRSRSTPRRWPNSGWGRVTWSGWPGAWRPGSAPRCRPRCCGSTRPSRRSSPTTAATRPAPGGAGREPADRQRGRADRHRRHGLPLPGRARPRRVLAAADDGRDAISEVPADRWDVDELYDPDRATPGTMRTRWGGFLDDVDRFDAGVLRHLAARGGEHGPAAAAAARGRLGGAGGRRARAPTSWRARAPACSSASATSDYARLPAARPGAHRRLHRHRQRRQHRRQPALLPASTCAGRAWRSTPPARRRWWRCTWRARACARRVAMALAGGVNLMLAPELAIDFSRAGCMAADGRCKTFDAAADGYVRGEGCGVVVLKPLSARAAPTATAIYAVDPRQRREPGRPQQRADRAERRRPGGGAARRARAAPGSTPGEVELRRGARHGHAARRPDRGRARGRGARRASRSPDSPCSSARSRPTSATWRPPPASPVSSRPPSPCTRAASRRACTSTSRTRTSPSQTLRRPRWSRSRGSGRSRTRQWPGSARSGSAGRTRTPSWRRRQSRRTRKPTGRPAPAAAPVREGRRRAAPARRAVLVGPAVRHGRAGSGDLPGSGAPAYRAPVPRGGLGRIGARPGRDAAGVVRGQDVEGVSARRVLTGGPTSTVAVFPGQGTRWWPIAEDLLDSGGAFKQILHRAERWCREHLDWSLLEDLSRPDGGRFAGSPRARTARPRGHAGGARQLAGRARCGVRPGHRAQRG